MRSHNAAWLDLARPGTGPVAGRIATALVLLLVVLVASPRANAGGSGGCTFLGSTMTVTLDVGYENVVLNQDGAGNLLANGVACGGATTANTSLIDVNDADAGNNLVEIDLSGGFLGPGNGFDDEIDIDVTLSNTLGDNDTLSIVGTDGADVFDVGTTTQGTGDGDIDLNLDGDRDVMSHDPDLIQIAGDDGNDSISAIGFGGSAFPWDGPVSITGDDGEDILRGGDGADTVSGGDHDDVVRGWSGADSVSGGAGVDHLREDDGINGADDLVGGADDDTVDYCSRLEGSVSVTDNGAADDGDISNNEGDNIAPDVERAVLLQSGLCTNAFPHLPNDDFVQPIEIGGASGSESGSNQGATAEPGEPLHTEVGGPNSVWYSFTAPSTGSFIFTTDDTDFVPRIVGYVGGAVFDLGPVGETRSADGHEALLILPATELMTYRIVVDGDFGGEGSFDLEWEACPGDETDCDGDALPDNEDNCPHVVNESQDDSNDNGIGNACEDDGGGGGGGPGGNDPNEPRPTPGPTPGPTGGSTPPVDPVDDCTPDEDTTCYSDEDDTAVITGGGQHNFGKGNDNVIVRLGGDDDECDPSLPLEIITGPGEDTIELVVVPGNCPFDQFDLSIASQSGDDRITVPGDPLGLQSTVDLGGGADIFAVVQSTIQGVAGSYDVSGGAGNDAVTIGSTSDSVTGGGGDDRIVTGNGKDTVVAGAGRDSVGGGAGRDRLDGLSGDDTLKGGDGHDVLHGGWGENELNGGEGLDRCLSDSKKDKPRGCEKVVKQHRRNH